MTHYNSPGIYLMDEPEAALSPGRQLSLLFWFMQMTENGAQFIIATHSPILLGTPGADIVSFDDGEVHRCKYAETESYKVTEMFVNQREMVVGGEMQDMLSFIVIFSCVRA